jgi:LCP family protein required for cell wall assembly
MGLHKKRDVGHSSNQLSAKTKVLIILFTILVLAAAFLIVKLVLDKQSQRQAIAENQEILSRIPSKPLNAIELNGIKYKPKTNLFSVLLLGIDKTQEMMNAATGYRNRGQCDFIMLVVIDREAKSVSRLMLDRDTITQINTLGVFGTDTGTISERLSLSFSFGDGGGRSAKFAVDAVKRVLPGVNIDAYVAMNLDAITNLNDVVGGVTLEVAGDYSAVNPDWTIGKTVTLHGKEAERYVRARAAVDTGTNEARMQRQKSFINALYEAVKEKIYDDITFVDTMFDSVEGNLITNMPRGRMVNELSWAQDYEIPQMDMLDGEHNVDAEGFMEFHADESSAMDWVLNVFYREQ